MPDEIHVSIPGRPEPFRFRKAIRVGRAATNDVAVDDDFVSGEHLELRPVDGGWELVDLGSTNGTFVDGARVTRMALGPDTVVRLGHPAGAELRVAVPGLAPTAEATRLIPAGDLADRYLGEEAPEDMSERTRLLRATIQDHRETETRTWERRTRHLRLAVVVLLLVAGAAAATAVIQGRRIEAQREAAAALFHTLKTLELDIRRIQAASGPDPELQERQARLEAQYEDLMTALGIYSSRTPPEVQLIYRTVHRLGESEATIPREFVDEVLRYVEAWKEADLMAGVERAHEWNLGPVVSRILLEHHLPREFFWLALQESKLDPQAIGPSTRFGVPKGMWQMIPGTAEAYGLRLGPLQGERQVDPADERHDVEKATAAAARYLADIYETDAQASGLLVMAAYNLGQTRLLRLLRTLPETPGDRNFWALMEQHREQVPEETYDYVYRVVSAAVIGADPGLFGFDFEPVLPPGDPGFLAIDAAAADADVRAADEDGVH